MTSFNTNYQWQASLNFNWPIPGQYDVIFCRHYKNPYYIQLKHYFHFRARLPTATREREPIRQPEPANREPILPARVPVPASRESVLPARVPVPARAQLPQFSNFQEEPRAIARNVNIINSSN